MGKLHYDHTNVFDFDDRTLTHLRTVIVSKFMMHESFLFTWTDNDKQRSIWLHPTVPMHFEFDAAETPKLNRKWVEGLGAASNSPVGLRITLEPEA